MTRTSRATAEHTISVPEAGKKYFGLSQSGSYVAARRGDFPVIRIGRLIRVPVSAIEKMLAEAGPASKSAA
jgi:hypothetical protein